MNNKKLAMTSVILGILPFILSFGVMLFYNAFPYPLLIMDNLFGIAALVSALGGAVIGIVSIRRAIRYQSKDRLLIMALSLLGIIISSLAILINFKVFFIISIWILQLTHKI